MNNIKHTYELLRSYLEDLDLFEPFRIEIYRQTGKTPYQIMRSNFDEEEKLDSIGDLMVAFIDFKKSPFWKKIYKDICDIEGSKPIWEKL